MTYPNLCIVDTNVLITANKAANFASVPDEHEECVRQCFYAVKHVIAKKCLVLDSGDRIFHEYRNQKKHLSMSGQPGVGDKFLKWVHDYRYSWPESQRVEITENGDSFNEFPQHEGLADFDLSDRKFVAVANAHPKKPAIIQATDRKWWSRWKGPLEECGITVLFPCKDYMQGRYNQTMVE